MVSTMSAKVKVDISLTQLLKQIFPSASITGAPKMRAMELINDLEMESRGVYTGAIGTIGPPQTICLDAPIRTLLIWLNDHGEMGVGSGVVHDSAAAAYDECEQKVQFFTRGFSDFNLIETLMFNGCHPYLERDLARLALSSIELEFKLNTDWLRTDLLTHAAEITTPTKSWSS